MTPDLETVDRWRASQKVTPVSQQGSSDILMRFAHAGDLEDGVRKMPPVDKWNPPFCGDLDMRIARDGTWFYEGTPIGRQRLVELFSRILRHDPDNKYYLVTPVEKVGIHVEDVPFMAVEMAVSGDGEQQEIAFRTNVGDRVIAGKDHQLRFDRNNPADAPLPYIRVRGRLEARVVRSVYYDLVALGGERRVDGADWFGVWSAGVFFPMAPASELEDASS